MTELLEPVILGVLAIVAATAIGRSLRIAAPLLLVAGGLAASMFLDPVVVPPEVILVGVLPPLLYSAAVRIPAIEFRRDFGPIAGLAVVLVVVSSLLLGLFFWWVIPDLDFALAVALGAIISPTDAVATSIAKRLGIAPRIVTMLEGESLLNDATALVLLRSAVAAVAAGFSFWGTVGSFAWGVAIAVVIGGAIGWVNLRVRRWVAHPAANTALGFVVPFVAYLPTEHLGGSGLVAAVVAGIITGQGATRWVTAEQRVSDTLTWRTIELVLEGAVFLLMGLELQEIIGATGTDGRPGPLTALVLALVALVIVLVTRTGFVTLLVAIQGRRARRFDREQWERLSDRLHGPLPSRPGISPAHVERRAARMRTGISRALNDIDYYQASALGWKHGTVIVWAGMRGVVTLAAAQTLPRETPGRDLLVLTAFLVAVVSLLLQGLTLPWLIRRLAIPAAAAEETSAERQRLSDEMRAAALARLTARELRAPDGSAFDDALIEKARRIYTAPPPTSDELTAADVLNLRIAMIEAERSALNTIARGGAYASATLKHAHASLDADQLSLQLRLDDATDEH